MDEQNQNNPYGQDSNSQYSGSQTQQNPNPNSRYSNYEPNSNGQYNQYGSNPNGQHNQYDSNSNGQYNQYGSNSNGQYNNQYGSNANNYQDYTMYSPNQMPYNGGENYSANGPQIASLVCGILGICLSCCMAVPGLVLGIAGLICAIIGNKNSKHGIGIAGLVCSIISLICGVIMAIYWGASFSEAFRMLEEMGYLYYD